MASTTRTRYPTTCDLFRLVRRYCCCCSRRASSCRWDSTLPPLSGWLRGGLLTGAKYGSSRSISRTCAPSPMGRRPEPHEHSSDLGRIGLQTCACPHPHNGGFHLVITTRVSAGFG